MEISIITYLNNYSMSKSKPLNVEDYIKSSPDYAQEKLNEIRSLLKSVAPNAIFIWYLASLTALLWTIEKI
jgi:hypothetical protein